ncbi:MAG: hypothetical protein JST31_00205 [Actinobacteria bacterium]|nr:hypothetical protein [Actinomycetota bacterium]
MPDLEQQLRRLGESVDYPSTPALAPRVGAELRAAATRPADRRRPTRLRLALLIAAAVLLLAAAAAAAVPATRHALLELLSLRGESVERVPALPANARARPGWRLGHPTTLAAASRRLSFTPLMPRSVGDPNGVFLDSQVPGHSLNLTYPPQAGLPRSRLTGVGLLVAELNGDLAPTSFGKLVPRGARVERFTIDGHLALWVDGLHVFFFKAADHVFHVDRSRLAANALLIQRGNVLVRLEGGFDKATAVAIARTLAP